jgi:hypothetical protein
MRYNSNLLLSATLFASLAVFAAPAQALVFDFSFTNTTGAFQGTVTGQIFGLVDNSTSAPTQVTVDTVPPGYGALFNSPVTYPLDTDAFVDLTHDFFTVVDGQITDADYSAQKNNAPNSNPGGGFELQLISGHPSGAAFDFQVEQNGSSLIATDEVAFSLASPVPEPSTWAMMILGFAGIGFMAYRRKSQGGLLSAA